MSPRPASPRPAPCPKGGRTCLEFGISALVFGARTAKLVGPCFSSALGPEGLFCVAKAPDGDCIVSVDAESGAISQVYDTGKTDVSALAAGAGSSTGLSLDRKSRGEAACFYYWSLVDGLVAVWFSGGQKAERRVGGALSATQPALLAGWGVGRSARSCCPAVHCHTITP